MLNLAFEYLNIVPFSEINYWTIDRYNTPSLILSDKFEQKNFGYFVKKIASTKVSITDENEYKIIWVRSYGKGAYINRTSKGKYLTMKQYQLAEENHLIWCKVDTKNGAFGIVTKELAGSFASSNMTLAKIDNSKILNEYLQLVFTSKKFMKYLDSFVSGTTNRKYIKQDELLSTIKIPLPSLEEQKRIIEAYNAKIKLAKEQEHQAQTLEKETEEYLFAELGLQINDKAKSNSKYSFLNFAEFKSISLWGLDKIYGIDKFKSLKYKLASIHSMPELATDLFRGKSPKYDEASTSVMLNQKCVRWDEIELQHAKNVDSEWLNQIDKYHLTKEGDILINSTGEGTIGRATCITNKLENLLYDSHILLLRLSKEMVNPKFLTMIINSNFGQGQINHIKSAQSTKQTELGVENLKKIKFPVPPLEIQNKIVKHLTNLKDQIKTSKTQSETNRTTALEEFEKELFE